MELLNVLTSGAVMGSVNSNGSNSTPTVDGASFANQLVQVVNNQNVVASPSESTVATTQLVSIVPVIGGYTLTTEELDQLAENVLDQLEELKDEYVDDEQLSMLEQLLQQLAALVQVITIQSEQSNISQNDGLILQQVSYSQGNGQNDVINKLQDQLLLLQQALQDGSVKVLQGKQPEVIISQQLQQLETSVDGLVKELKVKQGESTIPSNSLFVAETKDKSAGTHLQRIAQEAVYSSTAATTQSETTTNPQVDEQTNQPTTVLAMMRADNVKEFLPQLAKASSTTPSAFVLASEFADTMKGLIVQKFDVSSLNGVTEARLMLTPENLGHVDVKISMQNGVLTAIFQAETAMGKDALENQMAQLRASLASQGITVEKIEVTQSAFAAQLSQQQKQNSQQHLQDQSGQKRNDGDESFEDELVTNASHKELGFGRTVNETI